MKLGLSRIAWTFAVLSITAGSAVTFLGASTVQSAQDEKAEKGEKSAEAAEAPKKAAITTSAANSCLSDPVVLEEIGKKQQELEARQKELQSKEAELKAREAALNDELAKLKDLREEVAKLDDARRKANAEKVAKVIETLQAMSPKASAQFLTTLDDSLAVSAISQMDTAKLAKIMNVIDAKRGAKLTELLAGVVRAHNSAADAARGLASNGATETAISSPVAESPQAESPKKGGRTNDSTHNKSESIISGGPDPTAKIR